MKTRFPILILLVVSSFFFAGCPISINYPLGEKGVEKIDKNLIGVWKADHTDAEVLSVRVEKADEFTYNVTVQERGEMYAVESDNFTAWLTTLEGHRFLVLQELAGTEPTERFYLYHIDIDKKKLVTQDVSLKVGGVDAVTSTEAFREEVKGSMKFEDWLSSTTTWTQE